jgi:hypothetical protein
MRVARRKEEMAIFDRDLIISLLANDRRTVAEVMAEKGFWDTGSDEEMQGEFAAMSTFERLQKGARQNVRRKAVERMVEEFMKDVMVVWIDRGRSSRSRSMMGVSL